MHGPFDQMIRMPSLQELFRLPTTGPVQWTLSLSAGLLAGGIALDLATRSAIVERDRHLLTHAEGEASRVDLQLESYKAVLMTIAYSSALTTTEPEALSMLRREVEIIGDLFGAWFVLADSGDPVTLFMNTGNAGELPPPLPRSGFPEVQEAELRARQFDRPAVSDTFIGPVSGVRIVTLAMAAPGADDPDRYLHMVLDVGNLARLLAGHMMREDLFSGLIDGSGRMFVRSDRLDHEDPTPLPQAVIAGARSSGPAILGPETLGPALGAGRIFAIHPLEAAENWMLLVSEPAGPAFLLGLRTGWPFFWAALAFMLVFTAERRRRMFQQTLIARRDAEIEAAEKSALVAALEAASARKAKLLGVVGHELRTPLISQLGMLDLLAAGDPHVTDKDLIARAQRETHGMLGLLDDLLDVARLGTGEMILRPVPFDPVALLHEAAEILKPIGQNTGNSIAVKVSGRCAKVCGDAGAVRRILLNFGTNAAKFTLNGKITFGLSIGGPAAGAVDLRWSITDTGVGIAEADMPRIFEEFSVLEATQTLNTGGTGLGLAICKGLARAMGGQVWAESTPGEGSVFTFQVRLPLATPGRADRPRESRPDLSGKRILLVEDIDIMRMAGALQLKSAGAEVETVSDGIEAVEIAERQAFDVIVTDLHMPRLDGNAAARRIREGNGPNRATPIIGLTAHQNPDVVQRLSRGAIRTCLTKPLDLMALCDVLRGSDDQVAPSTGAENNEPDLLGWLLAEDPALAASLAANLVSDIKATLTQIEQQVRAEDHSTVAELAHKLAGHASLAGAHELGKALWDLERQAQAGACDDLHRACHAIRHLAEETCAQVHATLALSDAGIPRLGG